MLAFALHKQFFFFLHPFSGIIHPNSANVDLLLDGDVQKRKEKKKQRFCFPNYYHVCLMHEENTAKGDIPACNVILIRINIVPNMQRKLCL